ncbi:MAG: FecR domain-containing protein [Gammaproteobacteria bacterium]|nr:FecR domain-containing protein [Gammaproteobacteria bacterium]
MAFNPASTLLGVSVALASALALAPPARAVTQAGEVVIARGIATAQQGSAPGRIVGSGSPILTGDVVSTGPRSIALLKFGDGTRVTLRPETTFQVESFSTEAADAGAVYRLFKGGLRAVTGFLSKRNPNAVRLRTAVATIGIRGTEFDARLCGADCVKEAATRAVPAGRAGFIKGNVLARSTNGDRARALAAGGPVYSGETLLTSANSYAVLGFQDKSRVTLLPNTEFRVDQLTFDAAKPEEGVGVFALLRGGLRAVSGAIGHYRPNSYQMRTAVATIGIRGTVWGLYSEGSGQSAEANPSPTGDGVSLEVTQGAIDDGLGNVIEQGQQVFIGTPGMTPQPIQQMPTAFMIDVPKPNEVQLPDPLPPPPSSIAPPEGLIVGCYVGNCSVETKDNKVDLTPGTAGFVGAAGGKAEKLPEIPPFMPQDAVLGAAEGNPAFNNLDHGIEGGGSECSVQ